MKLLYLALITLTPLAASQTEYVYDNECSNKEVKNCRNCNYDCLSQGWEMKTCTCDCITPSRKKGIQYKIKYNCDEYDCKRCAEGGFSLRGSGAACTLRMELLTDNYPEETAWEVKDGKGSTIFSGDGFKSKKQNYNAQKSIPFGNYEFAITDTANDGVCCAYGNGNYKLLLDGKMVRSGGDFGGKDTAEFTCGEPVNVCDVNISVDVQANNFKNIKWALKKKNGKVEMEGDYTTFKFESSLAASKGVSTRICDGECYYFTIDGPNKCPYTVYVDSKVAATGGKYGCEEAHEICP